MHNDIQNYFVILRRYWRLGKLKSTYFFEDMPVLGKLPLDVRAKKFEEVGDKKTAKAIRNDAKALSEGMGLFRRKERLCEHTAHAFGFIPQI